MVNPYTVYFHHTVLNIITAGSQLCSQRLVDNLITFSNVQLDSSMESMKISHFFLLIYIAYLLFGISTLVKISGKRKVLLFANVFAKTFA